MQKEQKSEYFRSYALYYVLLFLQVNWVSKEWAKRAALPSHVVTMLDNFPTNLHPMSQFSAAITALNSESSFARAYSEGVHKTKYWEVSLHPFHLKPVWRLCTRMEMFVQCELS